MNVVEEIREGVDRDSANHFDNCGIVVTRHLEFFELLIRNEAIRVQNGGDEIDQSLDRLLPSPTCTGCW